MNPGNNMFPPKNQEVTISPKGTDFELENFSYCSSVLDRICLKLKSIRIRNNRTKTPAERAAFRVACQNFFQDRKSFFSNKIGM